MTALTLAAVLVVAFALIVGSETGSGESSPCEEKERVPVQSIGYLAYWDQKRGLASLAAAGTVDEVSPSWYTVDDSGALMHQDEGVDDSSATVAALRAHATRVLPAVANYRDKTWDHRAVEGALTNDEVRERHIGAIVDLVAARGFDGIDVDYEHLPARLREPFSRFVTELGHKLRQSGKRLSVTVHPKTSEPGGQPKNQAQDYSAIGRAADEVRIMLYDYHWDTSSPGPVAPYNWVRSVLDFAVTQIPREKLVLGLATYGYDWTGKRGESLMWREIQGRARTYRAEVRWDERSASPWFTYTDRSGRRHDVWFENAQSLSRKRAIAVELCLAGVSYWRLGGNDPSIEGLSGVPAEPLSPVATPPAAVPPTQSAVDED